MRLAAWLVGVLAFAGQAHGDAKKLVELGWDEPDTAFMRGHVDMIEQAPFDGTVFHVAYPRPDGTTGKFTTECWGRRAFTARELAHAADDLRHTHFRRFTENFLRVNVQPGDVDWFDDFTAVVTNARTAGRLAHEGRVRGIFLDVEQYEHAVFDWRRRPHHEERSFADYAAQVRQRGREVIAGFQDGFGPGLVLFLTFGASLPQRQSGGQVAELPATDYGLLLPFVEGLVDGAHAGTKIVDGYELSYGVRKPGKFDGTARALRFTLPRFVADAEKYRTTVSVGFGLWLDYLSARNGWHVDDPSANYFTPDGFEQALRGALAAADEYVWVYTQVPRWWSKTGRVAVPDAYVRAIERARAPSPGLAEAAAGAP